MATPNWRMGLLRRTYNNDIWIYAKYHKLRINLMAIRQLLRMTIHPNRIILLRKSPQGCIQIAMNYEIVAI